jgi:hypothetical protein
MGLRDFAVRRPLDKRRGVVCREILFLEGRVLKRANLCLPLALGQEADVKREGLGKLRLKLGKGA